MSTGRKVTGAADTSVARTSSDLGDAQGRGSGSSSSQQSARSWGREPVTNLAAGFQRGNRGHVQSPLSPDLPRPPPMLQAGLNEQFPLPCAPTALDIKGRRQAWAFRQGWERSIRTISFYSYNPRGLGICLPGTMFLM